MGKLNNTELDLLLRSIEELHMRIMVTTRAAVSEQVEYRYSHINTGFGDISYDVDTKSEALITAWFEKNAPDSGIVLISEGIGTKVFPSFHTEASAKWRVIMDPLDGTRHIMYDNRSCWILTGIAENNGACTSLSDIRAAIQTEVPPTLQEKSTVLKAVKGSGVQAKVINTAAPFNQLHVPIIQPSSETSLENGFVVFSNFFHGSKVIISDIEDRFLSKIWGEEKENGAKVFSEQYISNAGQLYMLMSGKYRMVADIRASLEKWQKRKGRALPLCSHPYDLAGILIAREAGCVILDETGGQFDAPLDLSTNCAWIAYANTKLMQKLHPVLRECIEESQRIFTNESVMPNGEIRYRMTGPDGSCYIRTEAGAQGSWQNAHYHKNFDEIVIIQKGKMLAITINSNGEYEQRFYDTNEQFIARANVPHNLFLFDGSVTHTVKYGNVSSDDWFPHEALDLYSKKLEREQKRQS